MVVASWSSSHRCRLTVDSIPSSSHHRHRCRNFVVVVSSPQLPYHGSHRRHHDYCRYIVTVLVTSKLPLRHRVIVAALLQLSHLPRGCYIIDITSCRHCYRTVAAVDVPVPPMSPSPLRRVSPHNALPVQQYGGGGVYSSSHSIFFGTGGGIIVRRGEEHLFLDKHMILEETTR